MYRVQLQSAQCGFFFFFHFFFFFLESASSHCNFKCVVCIWIHLKNKILALPTPYGDLVKVTPRPPFTIWSLTLTKKRHSSLQQHIACFLYSGIACSGSVHLLFWLLRLKEHCRCWCSAVSWRFFCTSPLCTMAIYLCFHKSYLSLNFLFSYLHERMSSGTSLRYSLLTDPNVVQLISNIVHIRGYNGSVQI